MDGMIDEIVNNADNFTAEQKLRLIKRFSAKKPSVNFSSISLADCESKDGLALDLKYILVRPLGPTLYIPESIPHPVPSNFLCQHLAKVQECFEMDNEAACRMLIDAILLEVLKTGRASEADLIGSCEVRNDWEGPRLGYAGTVHYMIGSRTSSSVRPIDSFLLVVEAKKEWPDTAVAQVLGEAGCLLKRRLEALKKTPVFAVLTNGTLFRFFAIDENGVVYSSVDEILNVGPSRAYSDRPSLVGILRWFNWFLGAMKDVSPRVSQTEMVGENVEESVVQLRCCFGPRELPEATESPKATKSKRIKT